MTIPLLEIFRMSFESLRLKKLRTFLAMLGIIIGVAGIMVIGVLGTNGKALIFEEIKTFGFETVWVYQKNSLKKHKVWQPQGSGINYNDIQSIKENIPSIRWVTPVVSEQAWASFQGVEKRSKVQFVNHEFIHIENDKLLSGRFLNQTDVIGLHRVCVIGHDIFKTVFGSKNALGQQLLINNTYFKVIGVLKEKDRGVLKSIGANAGNPNTRIFLPISISIQKNGQDIDYIQFSARSSDLVLSTSMAVISHLKSRHQHIFDYDFSAMKNYIDSANKILNIVSWMLGVSIAIAIIVGGIGIANIMTISVIERVKEIGIRKSLGARERDVFNQFLMESMILTIIAGFLGIIIGGIIILFLMVFIGRFIVFPMSFIAISFFVSLLVGVLSGSYPANWAAKQNPAVALRYE